MQRGYQAELRVIELLKTKGWLLSFHRLKTKIAEIDLVFEKKNKILLIEVKTLDDDWRVFQRLSLNQQLKYRLNLQLFLNKFKDKHTKAYIALVRKNKTIVFCEID